MLRADALEAIYPKLKDEVVVTIMGAVAVELYNLGHRPNFFYLEHGMGLASSMGLGLALSLPDQRVTVLDGDASLLMNLGTLSTMARYAPPNLTHIVFDNESLLSVGGFPSATTTGTDLAGIAREAGVQHVEKRRHRRSHRRSLRRRLRPPRPIRHPLQSRTHRPPVLRHGHRPPRKPLRVRPPFAHSFIALVH